MNRWNRTLATSLALGLGLSLASGCAPHDSVPANQPNSAELAPPPATEGRASVDLLNARTPYPDLLTGGQPTIEALEQAAAAGYRTVIDLRTPGENRGFDEATEVDRVGMTYLTLPVAGVDGLTADTAAALANALEKADGPVLLHCGSGNRVGALLALKAFYVDGLDADTAVELGRKGGMTSLGDTIETLLETTPN